MKIATIIMIAKSMMKMTMVMKEEMTVMMKMGVMTLTMMIEYFFRVSVLGIFY